MPPDSPSPVPAAATVDLGLSAVSYALEALDVDRLEGSDGGVTRFTFTVRRTEAGTGDPRLSLIAVPYGSVPASTVDAADFGLSTLPSVAVGFAAGALSTTVSIDVAADRTFERDETFLVSLQSGLGQVVVPSTALAVIRNDDPESVENTGPDLAADARTTGVLARPTGQTTTNTAAFLGVGDTDWFRFEARAGQTYLFEAAGRDDGAGTHPDLTLTLRDATGTVLASNDDSGLGFSARVLWHAASDATWFLDVGSATAASGSYQLSARDANAPDADPPGSVHTNRRLSPEEFQVGLRQSPTDEDWYAVDLAAGTAYAFAVFPIGMNDPVLRLRDAQGRLLATNDDAAADSLAAEIHYVSTGAQTVYLDVGAYNPSDVGAYAVSAQAVAAVTLSTYAFGTASVSAVEGTGGLRPIAVQLERSGALDQASSILVELQRGSTNDSDLALEASGAVAIGEGWYFHAVFAAGQRSTTLSLLANADATIESDESFTLRLAPVAGQAVGALDSSTITLRDDDATAGAALNPVFRFAKISNGAYFFTGSAVERDTIVTSYPDFRPEGVGFYAYAKPEQGAPVYRFANLNNGGYFYTGSAAERDATIQNYPHLRYEGSTFSVARPELPDAQPVFRLANLLNGAYLYTVSPQERDAAQELGFWRYEGVSFHAPPLSASQPVSDDYAATSSTTGRITIGQVQTGAIEVAGDADWFAISLTAGVPVQFDLRGAVLPSGEVLANPTMALYAGNGQLLAVDDDSGGSGNARIPFTPAASGTYFVAAFGAGDSRGVYSLFANAGAGGDDFPASSATAARLTAGTVAAGRVETNADVDWFGVRFDAGRSYTVTVATNGADAFRAAAELISPSGAVLAFNDNPTGNTRIDLAVTPAAVSGTYFVAVHGQRTTQTGAYTVTLAENTVAGGRGSVAFVGDEKPQTNEGNAADPGSVSLTVQRTGSLNDPATVRLALEFNDEASANDVDALASGFTANVREVTLAAGVASTTVRLFARGDTIDEGQPRLEAFTVRIVSATGVDLGTRTAQRVLIVDDDNSGSLFSPFDGALAGTLPDLPGAVASDEFRGGVHDWLLA